MTITSRTDDARLSPYLVNGTNYIFAGTRSLRYQESAVAYQHGRRLVLGGDWARSRQGDNPQYIFTLSTKQTDGLGFKCNISAGVIVVPA